jgi:hypothetical protein
MSLRYQVIEMIKERGCGTVDHLEPRLSQHGYTRAQIISALHNAKNAGLLWSEGRPSQKGKPRTQKLPAVYWPGKKPATMFSQLVRSQKDKPERVLIASAWDWGTPKPESAWPKGWQGQVFKLAGLMDEDEEETV